MISIDKSIKDHDCTPEFHVAVLGDLHLDPSDMELHDEGRKHIVDLLRDKPNTHMISLGDLGAYGSAGTSENFDFTKKWLDSFKVDLDIVTGNHDLEGVDEFFSDRENLEAWMKAFKKRTPHFCTEIAEKVLCVGLSTVRFRDTAYSSHEVYIDEEQIEWFDRVLEHHSAKDGWKVLVFTHAPIMGSGLRTLQGVHIKNGCAWINHTEEKTRLKFFELCNKHPCIRAWFSGHFHLSHDYEESITINGDHDVAFVQVGVIGEKSMRDGRRQTRLVRGDSKSIRIYTVNHHQGGSERLDMEMVFGEAGKPDKIHFPKEHDEWIVPSSAGWFSARTPSAEDGCFLDSFLSENPDADLVPVSSALAEKKDVVCWWHMADGRVLGVHDGLLVEYDPTTLAPLGVVVEEKAMAGKELMIVDNGNVAMLVSEGPEGVKTEVIHPNDDGSYWRKFQRNKMARIRQKQREELARKAAERLFMNRSAGERLKLLLNDKISDESSRAEALKLLDEVLKQSQSSLSKPVLENAK